MSRQNDEDFEFPSFLDVTRISWKQMLILPVIFLILNISVMVYNYSQTGQFVRYGIDFTGGTIINFPDSYELDPEEMAEELERELGLSQLSVTKGGGVLNVQTASNEDEILDYMRDNYGKSGTTDTLEVPLAETFQNQAPVVIVAAFVGMAIVVYVVFRSALPCLAVLVAAALDITEAMGLMTLFGIRMSLATVAALLMLIGYSVDTNILLTSRLLKRREEMRERLLGAMKTGLTMSATTLCAVSALYVFSTSDVLDSIAVVLLFGLVADLLNTWLFNAGLLRGFLERKFQLLKRRSRRRR